MEAIIDKKPGYKKTKLGWIPEEWDYLKLRDISEKIQDGTHFSPKVSQNGEFKYITSKNIRKGYLNLKNIDLINKEEHEKIYKRCDVKFGDILLTKDGASTGNACLNTLHDEISLLSSVAFIRANTNRTINEFLIQFILSDKGQKLIIDSMAGQAITRITLTKLRNFRIPLPPLPEQKKIAAILSTWDRAIETTQALIEQLQVRKKGLMQQLLTGKKRLKGFEGEWEEVRFSEFLNESREKGSNGLDAKKITVKLYGRGVLPKDDKRKGSINTKYYKRKFGQFIYSKLDFLNGAFGIIPENLDGYETTLDLPCFDIDLKKIHHYFLLSYVSREEFYSRYSGGAIGGRKAKRIQVNEFLSMKIPLPSLKEQLVLVNIFTKADDEISKNQSYLFSLQQQKKGLMQQLLTGQIRVQPDES